MTDSYRLRLWGAAVALWAATVALTAVRVVVTGALLVIEALAPAALWLAERVADLVAEVDQVCECTAAEEDSADMDGETEKAGMVVDGEVIAVEEIREEKVI